MVHTGSNWIEATELGYEPKTTFWSDFDIAEAFGISAIKDTFNRAFTEWKTNYIYLTELVMVMNHKCGWFNDYATNPNHSKNVREHCLNAAVLYNDLYEQSRDYAEQNLKGEELAYYLRATD